MSEERSLLAVYAAKRPLELGFGLIVCTVCVLCLWSCGYRSKIIHLGERFSVANTTIVPLPTKNCILFDDFRALIEVTSVRAKLLLC